jgi:hypothetical protein
LREWYEGNLLANPRSYLHERSTNQVESLHNSEHVVASKRLNWQTSYAARVALAIGVNDQGYEVREFTVILATRGLTKHVRARQSFYKLLTTDLDLEPDAAVVLYWHRVDAEKARDKARKSTAQYEQRRIVNKRLHSQTLLAVDEEVGLGVAFFFGRLIDLL